MSCTRPILFFVLLASACAAPSVEDAGTALDAGGQEDNVDGGGQTNSDAGQERPADAGEVSNVDGGQSASDAGGEANVDAGGSNPGTHSYFAHGAFFHEDVSAAAKSPDSDVIIAALDAAGGWGHSNVFQIDFSIDVLTATASTPMRSFIPSSAHYDPDCDTTPMPIPVDGNIEGEDGYACTQDGDCHLLVFAAHENRLYEMWRADIPDDDAVNGTFNGGCLATWDTSRVYPATGRGDQCTSADAAGFPIAPLLFSADEVAAGEINHAIRLILPNDRVRARRYVRPATHGTNTSGGANAPQYGVHFRLRADYPVDTLPTEGARVVARALQKYGMYHADGGQIALTAQSDKHTTAKWEGLLGPRDLDDLQVSDFEVLYHSDDIEVTFDCTRTPLTE
ncbi:MAG: hypothetical protein GY822_21060 [Deltaproteobacteria bacterium]|nr:hypothetical protein [Deltaproteobacteria bacterium]